MASDETMTVDSSTHEEDDHDEVHIEHHHHHYHHRHNMSRLSMCTSNSKQSEESDEVVDDDEALTRSMSLLSVEDGSEADDADGEFSDEEKEKGVMGFEDSDREMTGWYSLPASPQQRIGTLKKKNGSMSSKEYVSENESQMCRRRRGTRRLREKWLERVWEMRKEEVEIGESECVVIARAKGGGRSLCMDMDEIKACRDLGFDLKQEWMLELPPNKISPSTIDTDSSGSSPIATWRISSPGDDPRDVKARLKVWAQVVALTSASRLNG